MNRTTQEIVSAHKKRKALRERVQQLIGFVFLLSGYALLAVTPETPSDWLMLRVVLGFGALFAGFGLAIMPIVAKVTGGDQ